MNSKVGIVAGLVAVSLVLPGCSTVDPKVTGFKSNYYPQCYAPIRKLAEDQNAAPGATNAVAGAVFGAIVGGMLGALSGESKHVVTGMAIGAAAGGALGFGLSKLQKIKDQNERLEALKAYLGNDADQLDLEKASVLGSFRCYTEQMEEIKKAFANKRITKDEAVARMAEVKEGLANARTFWMGRADAMDEKIKEYDKFILTEARKARTDDTKEQINAASGKRVALGNIVNKSRAEVQQAYQQALQDIDIALNT